MHLRSRSANSPPIYQDSFILTIESLSMPAYQHLLRISSLWDAIEPWSDGLPPQTPIHSPPSIHHGNLHAASPSRLSSETDTTCQQL
ncbi:hypothetical protein CEP54_001507 [Fusarium duplospermum]|uniref:Uncharacterized protein n=1 Tax=Fusarium duplospermum TaxID=1325734 RepID=A0A428R0L2_9HYPO|nr:hypothetical protein CEP54_001507 [Fusarium duplospermum]